MSYLVSAGNKIFPKDWLRRRFLSRIRSRRGKVTLPFELEYRHIYVLPTLFGIAFGFMLIFMALGGLNFNNNMALMLVFVMATIAQLTMVLAYRNLVGLKIENILSEPVFAGEPAHFRVYLENAVERRRFAIQGVCEPPGDCKDLASVSTLPLQMHQATAKRGWLAMSPFKLETRYPLGLFRAWSWFFPEARCLVYPAPARHAPPLPRTGAGRSGKPVKGEGEQLHGLREYRRGDSLRRIAWRTSARHDKLYTREMETPHQQSCRIDWAQLPGHDTESRLSILTAWVLQADHRQVPYSLDIPGTQIPPGLGLPHRRRCLEALALYGI